MRACLCVQRPVPSNQSPPSSPSLSPSPGDRCGHCRIHWTRVPIRTKTRWLGANRDASLPSLISRVSAKRSNAVAGRYSRLFGNPSTYHRQSPPGTRSPRHDSGPHAQLFPHTRRSAINRIAASSEGRLMHIVAPTNALRFYRMRESRPNISAAGLLAVVLGKPAQRGQDGFQHKTRLDPGGN
jgi:hypothetical protein